MSSSWLKAIRRGCDVVGEIPGHSLDDITSTIKGADSGIPSIDTAIRDLPFTQVGDEVHVGSARWRDVEPLFRKGDIDEAFDAMSITHTITPVEKANFKKSLTPNSPDIKIDDLENKTTVAKKYHSDLDVVAKEDGDALAESLSASSKEKTKTFYQKLKAKAGPVAIGAGLFTTIIFGVDMWSDLNDAIAARNGCFVVKTSSGSTSCKVLSHTCGFGSEGELPCDAATSAQIEYNIRLMCLDFIASNNTAAISGLNLTGINPPLTAENLEDVLNVPTNIPLMVGYYETYYNGIMPDIEGCTLAGFTADCIACDTTQPTSSIYFVNGTELEGNTTLRCIRDSTLLDTLVDVSTEMGVEIFDAVGDSISGSFSGNLFLALFIILLIILGITFYTKFVKKPKDPNAPPKQKATKLQAAPAAQPTAPPVTNTMQTQQDLFA